MTVSYCWVQKKEPRQSADDDFRVRKMLFELRVWAILVTGHDELVAELFQIAAEAQFTGDTPDKFARLHSESSFRCGGQFGRWRNG